MRRLKRHISILVKWPLLKFLPLLFVLPMLYSLFVGFEIRNSNTQLSDSSPIKTKKFDHIVVGPAAGQGIPGRIQCNDLKAVTKHPLPSVSNVMESISFVTVFAIYNQSDTKSASARVRVGNATYDKTERAMAILNVFANFIKVTTPRSNIIVLSDPTSNFPSLPSNVAIRHISGDYSRNNLMLQRINCYIAFLEDKLSSEDVKENQVQHFIFTDSDVAVVGDLSHLAIDNFESDIALTFRNNKDQPLNSGFIFVRGTKKAMLKAKGFFERVLDAYKSRFKNAARMLGDQMALAWVVKTEPSFNVDQFKRHDMFVHRIHGTTILFLPCAIYNWTPPEGAGQFHGMPEDVKVIHFKGSRKRLMLESWDYFKFESNTFYDMMCFVLRSGRTKYDF